MGKVRELSSKNKAARRQEFVNRAEDLVRTTGESIEAHFKKAGARRSIPADVVNHDCDRYKVHFEMGWSYVPPNYFRSWVNDNWHAQRRLAKAA